jgi:plasmid stabilization system protein ParE
MITYKVLSAAAKDLSSAVMYYEAQCCGLGIDFIDEFERTVARICRFPDAWTLVSPGLRRCLLRRFPYAVFYSMENEKIIISSVADLRKNPENL